MRSELINFGMFVIRILATHVCVERTRKTPLCCIPGVTSVYIPCNKRRRSRVPCLSRAVNYDKNSIGELNVKEALKSEPKAEGSWGSSVGTSTANNATVTTGFQNRELEQAVQEAKIALGHMTGNAVSCTKRAAPPPLPEASDKIHGCINARTRHTCLHLPT